MVDLKKGDLDQFLLELTELSRKWGFAIADEPCIFIMEGEDQSMLYVCNDYGRLILG